MDLCKEFKTMGINESCEKICEGVDLDFQENLPQYLDDIEKIIRCTAKAVITDYQLDAGKITIHGRVLISITYLSSCNAVLSNVFEEDFTKQINTSPQSQFTSASICINNKYCNFRLINQRRIDIHSAFNTEIRAYIKNGGSYISECENVFMKRYNSSILNCKCCGVSSADFDESFPIASTASQIKNIINSFVSCYVDDKKIIKDKMLVKLKIEFSVLFTNDSDNIEKCEYSFSLSKIIETPECDEMCTSFVNADVSGIYVKSKANSSDILCEIEAAGNVTIDYRIFECSEISLVTDGYMSKFTTDMQKSRMLLKSNPVYYYDDRSDEVIFDCDKNIIEIIDLNVELAAARITEASLNIDVKLSFIYYDDSNEMHYYEMVKTVKYKLCDASLDGEGTANLLTYDYVIKGTDKISVRISYIYSAYLYKQEYVDFITDIDASDEKNNLNMPQLTLYFADVNENIWDIAKKFSTDMRLIMQENNLTSQVIQNKTVLLVPGM